MTVSNLVEKLNLKVLVDGDMLKIKIREIPENGRANVAIVDLLHKILLYLLA